MKTPSLALVLASLLVLNGGLVAEEWESILQQALGAEHSQTRRDGLKQVDTNTVKGLRTLWKVLARREPMKLDWYVRKGAQEAIARAEGPEAEAEIDRVLGVAGPNDKKKKSGGKDGAPAEDELAREAIVHGVIEKIREAVVRKNVNSGDDRQIADFRYKLRKTRGIEYFALVLPAIKEYDPEKKQLRRLQTAFTDKSPRVRRAAIHGLTIYPDGSSIPLLIESLRKLEKQKAQNYREWVLTRGALETLSGQYFREVVDDWAQWWEIEKDKFSIDKRVEDEKERKENPGKTVVVQRDGITVSVEMKVAGHPEGYPLLVLPLEGKEVDYMRPYFHGVEEMCKVYYLRMPQIEDFKGLARDEKSNTIKYPTAHFAKALVDILKDQSLERFGLLAHGPQAGTLAMMFTAENPAKVSHLVLINPRSAGNVYSAAMDNVRREGMRTGNKEIVKGVDSITQMEDGKAKYKPSDDAEAGGLGRALSNLHFPDASEPEAGLIDELYDLPGGTSRMNDNEWSGRKILANVRSDLPVLIFMGEKAVWTPLPDQQAVASIFKRATVAKMAHSADYPFISETYLFTRQMEAFFKPALQARRAKEAKDLEKEKKGAGKAEKKAKAKKDGDKDKDAARAKDDPAGSDGAAPGNGPGE